MAERWEADMNDKNNRPTGDGPEGAVEAELRRRERERPGRDAGPEIRPGNPPAPDPAGPPRQGRLNAGRRTRKPSTGGSNR